MSENNEKRLSIAIEESLTKPMDTIIKFLKLPRLDIYIITPHQLDVDIANSFKNRFKEHQFVKGIRFNWIIPINIDVVIFQDYERAKIFAESCNNRVRKIFVVNSNFEWEQHNIFQVCTWQFVHEWCKQYLEIKEKRIKKSPEKINEPSINEQSTDNQEYESGDYPGNNESNS